MKLHYLFIISSFILWGCSGTEQPESTKDNVNTVVKNVEEPGGGQASVIDNESEQNILQVAIGSKDHKTLVAAVQAVSYENALVNAGPFTVFAPTDEAFGLLPEGTVEELIKPENKMKLQDILEYHVYIGKLDTEALTEGRVLGMANGDKITCGLSDDTVTINGAKIIASVTCSNGIVHVVDGVLLPE
jgi:uncharacterized surface protein with fasciclin (FAS1) repeats